MGCLYQLTSPSGKSYLGISSKTAAHRFAKHVEHALGKRENGVIYSALRKYGSDQFQIKTLVIANDWEYLCDLEKKAIIALQTRYPHGYNMTDGGEGIIGPKSEDFPGIVSKAQKKRYQCPEQRKKLREYGAKGRAMRAASRAPGPPPWILRKKAACARLGSAEHRAKISAATRLAMARPEIAAKVKQCALDRAANPAWRKKISDIKRKKTA